MIAFIAISTFAALIFGGVISLPNVLPSWVSAPLGLSEEAPVLIENYSDHPICYVYISPSGNDNWGNNWLGENESILPGEAITFWVATSESIDMQVLDCGQSLLDEQYGIPLTSEGITYTLSPTP